MVLEDGRHQQQTKRVKVDEYCISRQTKWKKLHDGLPNHAIEAALTCTVDPIHYKAAISISPSSPSTFGIVLSVVSSMLGVMLSVSDSAVGNGGSRRCFRSSHCARSSSRVFPREASSAFFFHEQSARKLATLSCSPPRSFSSASVTLSRSLSFFCCLRCVFSAASSC